MANIVLDLSPKLAIVLSEAIQYRIDSMQILLDNEQTPDQVLTQIDYGNDQRILQMILDEIQKQYLEQTK